MNLIIDLINFILDGIAESLLWVVDLLPASPAVSWSNSLPENLILGHITWFIPFPTMIVHLGVFLTALAVYYLYRVVGRWLKLVRS